MQKVKAIIFDMNGTVFDTAQLVQMILKESFEKLNIKLSEEDLDGFVGKNFHEMKLHALKFATKEQVEEGINTCMKAYQQYIAKNGTPIKIGLRELIVQAKCNNIKVAIATCAPSTLTDFLFQCSKLDKSYFDVILTGDDVKNAKPDTEIYLKACKMLNLNPKDCMAIEDSYIGLEAARNAGLVTVRVQDCQKPDATKNNLVDYSFNNLLDLWFALKMAICDLGRE